MTSRRDAPWNAGWARAAVRAGALCLAASLRLHAQEVIPPSPRAPALLSWSIETARDTNLADEGSPAAADQAPIGYSDMTVGLRLLRSIRRFELTLGGGGVARYQSRDGRASALKDYADASFATPARKRTVLRFAASRTASPYALLVVSGPTSIQSSDFAVDASDQLLDRRMTSYQVNGNLTTRLGRGLSIGTEYDLATKASEGALRDFRDTRAAVRATERLGKSWAAVAAAAYRRGSVADEGAATVADVEVTGGLEYRGRGVHGIRVSGGVGSAATGADGRGRRQATGYVHADRGVGRRWTAGVDVQRAVEFSPLFRQPLLAASYTVAAAGRLSRRADVTIFAGYWTGTGADGDAAPGFRSYRGGARLRVTIAPRLAVYGEYLRLDYRAGALADASIVPSIPLQRMGLRLGLTSTLPLLR